MIHLLTFLSIVIKVNNMHDVCERARDSKTRNRCNSFFLSKFIVSKSVLIFLLSAFCKDH